MIILRLIVSTEKVTFWTRRANLLNAFIHEINNDFVIFKGTSFRELVIEMFDFIKNVTVLVSIMI